VNCFSSLISFPLKLKRNLKYNRKLSFWALWKENKLNPAGEALINVCVILTNIDDILLQTLLMAVLVTVLEMETVWLETATVFLALEDPTAAEVTFLFTYSSISLLFSLYYFRSFIPAVISASLSLSLVMVAMFFS